MMAQIFMIFFIGVLTLIILTTALHWFLLWWDEHQETEGKRKQEIAQHNEVMASWQDKEDREQKRRDRDLHFETEVYKLLAKNKFEEAYKAASSISLANRRTYLHHVVNQEQIDSKKRYEDPALKTLADGGYVLDENYEGISFEDYETWPFPDSYPYEPDECGCEECAQCQADLVWSEKFGAPVAPKKGGPMGHYYTYRDADDEEIPF